MGAAGGIAVGVDAFAPERLVAAPHRRAFGLLCQDTSPTATRFGAPFCGESPGLASSVGYSELRYSATRYTLNHRLLVRHSTRYDAGNMIRDQVLQGQRYRGRLQ